jgi:hypothetical protein
MAEKQKDNKKDKDQKTRTIVVAVSDVVGKPIYIESGKENTIVVNPGEFKFSH